jgi:hypothetical protein
VPSRAVPDEGAVEPDGAAPEDAVAAAAPGVTFGDAVAMCRALRSTGAGPAGRRKRYLERFATLRSLLLFRVAELGAAQEARAAVETRYLGGHTALFPDAVAAWDEQVSNTETLTDVACRLAEIDGVPPAEPPDPDAASARVTELVADLVEPAKTTALEKLGEDEQAQRIAIGWLRPKLLLATPG